MTEHIMKKRCSKVEIKCFHLAVNAIHSCSCFRVRLVIQNCLPQFQQGTVIIQDALKCFISHSPLDWEKDTESNTVRGKSLSLNKAKCLGEYCRSLLSSYTYSVHHRSKVLYCSNGICYTEATGASIAVSKQC